METEDIPQLPPELQQDYYDLIEPALKTHPLTGGNLFDTHELKGKLKGYRALEIEFNTIAYRLVYRVYDKPTPRRVEIISIGEHDPAYDQAMERINK
nr:type II toxin-antitoxin system mRNA interferase toxin, RelE/StbE family [Gloeothece verrucosa]